MNIEKLIESILSESEQRFSPEIEEKLFLLNSSKTRGGITGSGKVDFMDKVFSAYKGKKVNKMIYRSIYPEEYRSEEWDAEKVGDIVTINRYKSFTENVQVAQEFNTQGYGIIAIKTHIGGFPYWKWMLEFQKELKLKDPEKYNSIGNDMYEHTAKYEKEWIFNVGTKYVYKGWYNLKELDDTRVYEAI